MCGKRLLLNVNYIIKFIFEFNEFIHHTLQHFIFIHRRRKHLWHKSHNFDGCCPDFLPSAQLNKFQTRLLLVLDKPSLIFDFDWLSHVSVQPSDGFLALVLKFTAIRNSQEKLLCQTLSEQQRKYTRGIALNCELNSLTLTREMQFFHGRENMGKKLTTRIRRPKTAEKIHITVQNGVKKMQVEHPFPVPNFVVVRMNRIKD